MCAFPAKISPNWPPRKFMEVCGDGDGWEFWIAIDTEEEVWRRDTELKGMDA